MEQRSIYSPKREFRKSNWTKLHRPHKMNKNSKGQYIIYGETSYAFLQVPVRTQCDHLNHK